LAYQVNLAAVDLDDELTQVASEFTGLDNDLAVLDNRRKKSVMAVAADDNIDAGNLG
jgi:hypothetical protein